MSNPLNKDSIMECSRHGDRKPAFVCRHLQHGEKIGFFSLKTPLNPIGHFGMHGALSVKLSLLSKVAGMTSQRVLLKS